MPGVLPDPRRSGPSSWKGAPNRYGWTCFFCDETFTTPGEARDHFGNTPIATAGCQIKFGEERGLQIALRRAEKELASYRAEDTEKDRAYWAMQAKQVGELRRAEEEGYARGLSDGREIAIKSR
jgi:hypothetical protein